MTIKITLYDLNNKTSETFPMEFPNRNDRGQHIFIRGLKDEAVKRLLDMGYQIERAWYKGCGFDIEAFLA